MKYPISVWNQIRNATARNERIISLTETSRGRKIYPNHFGLKEVVLQLSRCNLELDALDSFYERVQDVVEEPMVQRWLNVEKDKEILEALVQDAPQAVELGTTIAILWKYIDDRVCKKLIWA